MQTTIAKRFRWEMSHRLADHASECRNIHGHSYRLEVILEGVPDEDGMVVEFAVIRGAVQPIIDALDHAFLCHDGDKVMLDFLVANDLKRVVVPFITTTENLTAWIADQIAGEFLGRKNVSAMTVRLHETRSAYAEVKLSINE